jgi:hypothetical protein
LLDAREAVAIGGGGTSQTDVMVSYEYGTV